MRYFNIHQSDPTSHLVPAKWDHMSRASDVYMMIGKMLRKFLHLFSLPIIANKSSLIIGDRLRLMITTTRIKEERLSNPIDSGQKFVLITMLDVKIYAFHSTVNHTKYLRSFNIEVGTLCPCRHSTKHGLDWTGQLDWTAGLDSWTGLLDWDSFLLNRRNSMFLRKVK